MMLTAGEGLVRLVMAELVRQQLDATGEAEQAARLIKVTGYRERDVDRYPGTTSWWVENYVDIFWADDSGETYDFEFRGTFDQLTAVLERLIEEY